MTSDYLLNELEKIIRKQFYYGLVLQKWQKKLNKMIS